MAQTRTIKPQDIAGLEAGLSLVSGTPQERFFQTLVDYFINWSVANSAVLEAGRVASDKALLVLFSESPKLEPGVPEEAIVERQEVFSALLTLDDGVAVAVESLSEVIQLVPGFKRGATEAFQFVRRHLRAEQTFALLLLGQSRILVHDEGVAIDEWMKGPRTIKVKQLDESEITPELVAQQLDEFHNEALAFPQGTIARLMWKIEEEPTPSELVHEPELHVQSGLLTYFRGLYRNKVATIDEEVSVNEGRVDVRLVRFDENKQRRITMIELKVLKPRGGSTTNLKWALKGIGQAHGYKKTNFAETAFACIYDARSDKKDKMPSLQVEADAKGVLLKIHPMQVPDPRKPKRAKGGTAAVPKAVKLSRPTSAAAKKTTGSSGGKKRPIGKNTKKAA